MTENLTDFTWQVPMTGFRFVRAKELLKPNDKTVRCLVVALVENLRWKEYRPLIKSGLFKRFAEIEPDESGILKFANRYGSLGGKAKFQADILQPPRDAEWLNYWTDAITSMREMVELWEAAKRSDTTALSKNIEWRDGNRIAWDSARSHETIAAKKRDPDFFERFSQGDLIKPAMYFLQRRVNEELAEHTVAARLLWDHSQGQLVIRLSPTSLIGALWLQFARAIEGNKDYLQCQNCRDWIQVGGARSARSDRKFCSQSCKSAFHRKVREGN